MINSKTILGALLMFTLLLSCGGGQRDDNNTTKQETPNALQKDKLDIKRYSRSGDLTDELYQELVGKTPALKRLEDELDALRPKRNELNETFNQYDRKSTSYYNAANVKATAITDSLLRMKILSLISTSSKKYSGKTADLHSLLKHISGNSATLNDHHSVLKIVLTLPIIETYQNDHKPNKKGFKDLINEQVKLLSQIDRLTPAY